MRYPTGPAIQVGDKVLADGMSGVIVCDFDRREFADGYKKWDDPTVEMYGGGTLSSGLMIDTTEAGLIHYTEGSGVIEPATEN